MTGPSEMLVSVPAEGPDDLDQLRRGVGLIAGQLATSGQLAAGYDVLQRAWIAAQSTPAQLREVLRSLVDEGRSRLERGAE